MEYLSWFPRKQSNVHSDNFEMHRLVRRSVCSNENRSLIIKRDTDTIRIANELSRLDFEGECQCMLFIWTSCWSARWNIDRDEMTWDAPRPRVYFDSFTLIVVMGKHWSPGPDFLSRWECSNCDQTTEVRRMHLDPSEILTENGETIFIQPARTEGGNVRRWINCFVNDNDIRDDLVEWITNTSTLKCR